MFRVNMKIVNTGPHEKFVLTKFHTCKEVCIDLRRLFVMWTYIYFYRFGSDTKHKNTAMRNKKPLIYGTADMTSSHPVLL